MSAMQLPPQFQTYTAKELVAAGHGSRSAIYKKVALQQFPPFFKRGGKVLWLKTDIDKHNQKGKP